eukprot:4326305-Prymnesium_polylepis.1
MSLKRARSSRIAAVLKPGADPKRRTHRLSRMRGRNGPSVGSNPATFFSVQYCRVNDTLSARAIRSRETDQRAP